MAQAQKQSAEYGPISNSRITHKQITARGNKNRLLLQENLRDKMASQGHISYIVKLDKQLTSLVTGIQDAPSDEQDAIIKKNLAQAKIIETRLGVQFRMLNKYLPDLKSIELFSQEGDSQSPEQVFTTALLRAKESSKKIDADPVNNEWRLIRRYCQSNHQP